MTESAATTRTAEGANGRSEAWARVRSGAALFIWCSLALVLALRLGLLFKGTDVGERNIRLLWPPNAVLLASFLLVPVRRWWIVALAGYTAAVAGRWDQPTTIQLNLLTQSENLLQALLGATGIRLLTGAAVDLDRLRHAVAFIAIGSIAAPFVSRYVTSTPGTRSILFTTNLLTTVALTPAILGWVKVFRARHWPKVTQIIEVVIALVGLVAVSALVFARFTLAVPTWVATVYLLFPFLIWMTLRVSSTATHTGILLVTLVANWSASHGYGPFQNLPPQDSAMALQLFLAGLAMPVLCLAAANHERNQALQFNKDLSGRLMTAQEEERARIAQDLHDDVNQRLAYIGLLASQIRRDLPGTADAMANLQTKVADAAEAVRLASRQLYPASLEQAGLRAAASALCLEFAQLTGRKLDFVAEPGYLALPQPAALCLYRILQESLQNVERHSHATEVRVSLSATADRVLLTVVDNGRGFSRNEARGSTLGLRSMEHRVESVGGAVEVKGRPGVGTVVRAWVPRAERAKAARA